MTQTTHLQLPLLAASQAQKHLTHNEALIVLDHIVHLSVLDRHLSSPPGTTAQGDRYLIAASASGLWSGQSGKIAIYDNAAWTFFTPQKGWLSWVENESMLIIYDGLNWIEARTGNSVALCGINATADTTNRLSVASDASLFSHNGDHHRLKINKAAAAHTATVLFQNSFSGRAEIGLAGSDDFSFKVSADGSAWTTALTINRTSGAVSFPNTSFSSGRDVLAADRTYYVRSDGSDSNNGLANTAGGAFLTIQKAVDVVAMLDLGNYNVTIQVGAGTRTSAVTLKKYVTSAGYAVIQGDTATPSNCTQSVTGNNCFLGTDAGKWSIKGFKLVASGASGLIAVGHTTIQFQNIDFGACGGFHTWAQYGGLVQATGNYSISGAATGHMLALFDATISVVGVTVTSSGSLAWSQAFANSQRLGRIEANGNSYTGGTHTGSRYYCDLNSIIFTAGGGASYFPGNAAGSTATGGQYS